MKEVEILLIEDNHGDVLLTQEAFLNWNTKNNISAVNDGEEAILYLKASATKSVRQLPDLIILDINLPKLDGKQVLQFIRSEADLQHLPVVIFSSSVNEADIRQARELKADLYLQKPAELQQFFDAVLVIEQFWATYHKANVNV